MEVRLTVRRKNLKLLTRKKKSVSKARKMKDLDESETDTES